MIGPEFRYNDTRIYHVPTCDPITLVRLCTESVPYWFRRYANLRPEYSFPSTMIDDLRQTGLSQLELFSVCGLAFFFTLFRYVLTWYSKVWIQRHNILPLYSHKLPEAIWKFIYYGGVWLFALYIHKFEGEIDTFDDPLSMWKECQSSTRPKMVRSIVILYAIQSAFYLHSVYATLFMDLWRKDSWIMFSHHFIALALLYLSYVDNYLLAGALVLFLQDNSDAALEITKLCVYTRKRTNGDYYPLLEFAGNAVFFCFAGLWIVCRLYWYPCKLLYATIYGAVYLGPQDAPFFPLLGLMLTLVMGLNIYWFNFIAQMSIRVYRTGEEPEDNREWDTTTVSGKSHEERLKESINKKESRKNK